LATEIRGLIGIVVISVGFSSN